MKEHKHIWEADVRQRVVEHEFGYEPKEWEGMSKLLDEVGTLPADLKPGPLSDFELPGFWKAGFFTLLTVGVIAFSYLWVQQSAKPSEETGVETKNYPLSIEEQGQEIFEPDPQPTKADKTLELVQQEETQPSGKWSKKESNVFIKEKEGITDPEYKEEGNQKITNGKEVVLPERERILVVVPLPVSSKIPLLEWPERSLDLEIQLPGPKPPNRKRDRRNCIRMSLTIINLLMKTKML